MPGEPETPVAVSVDEARSRPQAGPSAVGLRRGVLVAIGAGGALGSVARYEVAVAVPTAVGEFPWATYLVNVTGSLALGVVMTLVIERWPPTRYVRPFVGIGVCGGYTTWSTFMTDSTLLVRGGHLAMAVGYLAATLICGLAATMAGIRLGRCWPGDRRRARRAW
jgi:fluoride exporter